MQGVLPQATDVRSFMGIILDRALRENDTVSYRGLADEKYELTPSIFRRTVNKEQEHILLRELVAAHPEEFRADSSTLEKLVRMQHYELPTRLLDVSFNPLVALYFAAQDGRRRSPAIKLGKRVVRSLQTDGNVIIFTVARKNVKYFDSDTVSVLANLAQLSWDHKKNIDTTKVLDKFNEDLPVRRLIHFIRQEKYEFEKEIVPSDLDKVLLVKPKLNNRRIVSQNGAFFLLGQQETIGEPNRHGIGVERILIPANSKGTIRSELDRLNINEKTLFPELDRAARYLTKAATDKFVSTILTKP